ncbi:hypothetical protein Pmar_PMAR026371 [Perkinsus marinus ATCC 50983]|uniref:Uncharacterized protein n=1 Tax=Perkinsus marinus (strain ATCC 50983 / TXsc) TaxID=423536 RepID=C5LEK1_PERM5|nr:hypothetical protein Pmar_PMAR026371 [Perkinsus marinus ATCC 50983]EER04819.1 hypothetical protein Pmar_PMAR026371 [Perkinsus marinus ATCC 50983]|eukprot:XP_002773003.1 hypothetical protein Pmar_PMAR026371 [Perkinsus marinus ATCC 50983]
MFVRISVATIALTSLAEGIVVDRPSGDEKPLMGSFDDLELTPEAINLLKEYEADLIKQNEEFIASSSATSLLAAVSADGSFSYPPGCSPDIRPEGKYFCFHGKRNTTRKGKEVTAIVDVFDLKDPQDNVALGMTATFDAKRATYLDLHAGGEAEVVAFGNRNKLGAAISLATYDMQASSKPGLLGRLQTKVKVDPRFKIYVLGYQVINVEHTGNQASYVYATKPGTMGFNVSTGTTNKIKLGTAGASLHLTLDTYKNNDSVWILKGTGMAFVNIPLIKLNIPVTFINDKIVLPQ